jgi:aldehyde:ferredoxin oxidoreductase
VDLTTGRIKREKTDPADAAQAVGGRGLNSLRLYRELPRKVDPLSPENYLIIGVGPLTGTLLPASAYMTISGKSPLTGILGDSAAGGHFGAELKHAGYDQIIFTGRAERLSCLVIADDTVEIRDAAHLAGRDIWETTTALRRELTDPAFQIAAIGPAGENQVKYATVACNHSRMCGRTGMGCLFGTKNLKAVAVRGTKRLSVADTLPFAECCRKLDQKIFAHPEYEKRKALGSPLLMKALNGLGILPTDHFQKGVCDYVDRVSGERIEREFKRKHKSCFNCGIHCSRYYVTPEVEAEGPEFETLCSFTSRIGNDDIRFALKMNAYLNRMGLDSLSAGETIGWAMECVQRELLSADDFDGLDFRWGNRETVEKLLHMIVHRRGIGDAFAEGTRALAEKYGEKTKPYAFQVKGLDMICGDPRGLKAFGLTYAIASRGADHLRAEPFFELTNRFEESEKRFGTQAAADRLADSGKAALVEYTERQALLTDCLTMCKNIGLSMDIIDFETAAALLKSGTGLSFTTDRLNRALLWVINAERRLNIDFGVTADDDTLPPRFTGEPLAEGPSRGQVVPVIDMVQEYYRLRGWDDRGRPPDET